MIQCALTNTNIRRHQDLHEPRNFWILLKCNFVGSSSRKAVPMKPLPKTRRPVRQRDSWQSGVGVGRSSGEGALRVYGLGIIQVFGDISSVRGTRVSHDVGHQYVISVRVCSATVKLLIPVLTIWLCLGLRYT